MVFYYESINLKGFSHWMQLQTQEEIGHAMKLYNFLIERGGRAEMSGIEAFPSEWKSPTHAFEEIYNHERAVTEMINDIVNLEKKRKIMLLKSFFNCL